jgi:DNA-binding NarL/FixJ family response regulator
MIRVDILDRSPVFTHGLIHVLGQAGIVGLAADAAARAALPVDVSVVDPRVLGMERTLGFIAEQVRDHPVVALVDDASCAWAAAWLRAGAAQVLDRYADPDTLVRAILAATARLRPGPPRGPGRTDPCDQAEPSPSALSGRESEVLRLIAEGCTHHQVAHRLGISGHTVDTYVKRIRTKLGVATKAELIRLAVRDGLLSA